MAKQKIRDSLLTFVALCIILFISIAIIAYGRGYRLDFKNRSFGATGLLTTTSDPIGAVVFINGKRRTATNTNFTVSPGWYTIAIAKEGYQTWEKRIRVQGEIVARADAMLFPSNPSLSAITNTGVLNPLLSPDGTKLVYTVPATASAQGSAILNRAGIWVLDLADKPISVNRDVRQILAHEVLDTANATLLWSPNSKELLIELPDTYTKQNQYYLLDADKLNELPKVVFDVETTLANWKEVEQTKKHEQLIPLKTDLQTVAGASMNIISFSPDETKILYEATASASVPPIIKPSLIGTNPTEEIRTIKPGTFYVYDIKEDRNYAIGSISQFQNQSQGIENGATSILAVSTPPLLQWLPTSRHLIFIEKDKIEVMEYDNTNRKTLYAGPFWDSFVRPWTNASKLLILTNLNPTAGEAPNLYTVNIR